MYKKEGSAVMSLGMIMAFRMLGLFMILPIFSVQANKMPGATYVLIGIALGIYGLTQAALQMPFGMLSDRIGRKKVILMGLILFTIGSIVAAMSHTIEGIIVGRALQGGGAIGSTLLATIADLTRDENRSKAMAFVGLLIGSSFMIAMILGPLLNHWFHLSGIFWVTAGLAILGIVMLYTVVPNPPKVVTSGYSGMQPRKFKDILSNTQLLRLNVGIFSLHGILTALFIAIPIMLNQTIKLSESHQIYLYLFVLIISFCLAVPFIIISEKKRKLKPMLLCAIAVLGLIQMALIFLNQSTSDIVFLLLIFFTAFTLLEASLPSLVSKISPIRNRGTAMGIYSTSQFFGIFVGGAVGGMMMTHLGLSGVFMLCLILSVIWLLCALSMAPPPYLSTVLFGIEENRIKDPESLSAQLKKIAGVAEVALMPEEKLIYVKVDKKIITEPELRNVIETGNLA